MKTILRLSAGMLLANCATTAAFAWGATGHYQIGHLGTQALGDDLPAFLQTLDAAHLIGELGREPDRWKGSGETHDKERDPGHYMDLDEEGRVFGGPTLVELPLTREDYDTLMREHDHTQYSGGYLYYSIIDGWQQIRKDFAMWRVLARAEELTTDLGLKARFARDRKLREMLIVRDIGIWTHYIGDASMPLHVCIYYNGWTGAENPDCYRPPVERGQGPGVHAKFEGDYVRANITMDEIAAPVAAPTAGSNETTIEAMTQAFLTATWEEVEPLYEMDKDGAFDTGAQSPEADAFVAGRMATAVAEMRDMIQLAWNESEAFAVGYPTITLEGVEAGDDVVGPLWGLD